MKNVDAIILSWCKTQCTVYYYNGTVLRFDFLAMGFNYVHGLVWLRDCLDAEVRKEDERAAA